MSKTKTKTKCIPGTNEGCRYPDNKDGWTNLYKDVPYMSAESCERMLDANGLRTAGWVLLELRHELSRVCLAHGANRYAW